jgi:hypothetical protein
MKRRAHRWSLVSVVAVCMLLAAACQESLVSPRVPAGVASNDPKGVTLGLRFRVTVPGVVKGVRFLKTPGNDGEHTGFLWTDDGSTLLASGTFTDEPDATAWTDLTFPSPVRLTPGVQYVIAYRAPNGHYAYQADYFVSNDATRAPKDVVSSNGDIVGVGSSAAEHNGVFIYDDQCPVQPCFPPGDVEHTFHDGSYFVDVDFNPDS